MKTNYREVSYWLENVPGSLEPDPPLVGTQECDVAVIGGGYTGLSTAYHLLSQDTTRRVTVLEGGICGFGASGRNGGFAMTLFGLTKPLTRRRFGDRAAREAHLYMEEAVDHLDHLVTSERMDCDYERSGYLLVAGSQAQAKRLEQDFAIAQEWGLADVERWSADRLAQEFRHDTYQLGWFEKRCGLINPARMCRELKRLALARGARIHEETKVTSIARRGTGRFVLETDRGRLTAEHLVMATNAYSFQFPELRAKQTPAFTYIVLSEPLSASQLDRLGWKSRCGVEDARHLIHYYRLTKDNRILMGGGDVGISFGPHLGHDRDPAVFAHLEAHFRRLFPSLADLRFTHRWGGPVSVTVDMAPVIGFLGPDRKGIYSFGMVGHGVSMTVLNGRTIAELILGKRTSRTEMFFIGRRLIPWPPEPLRYIAGAAVRQGMRIADRLTEGY